jgi:hypothetical protein
MPSDRGKMGRTFNPTEIQTPRIPDVNSGLRSAIGDNEHRRGLLPPLPPLPPLPGMSSRDYRDRAHDHYNRYADHWFGGDRHWRHFIHSLAPAPWFWPSYSYVCAYPWVYGYYDPGVYLSFGWSTPYWYGRTYAPWWDWCDAPFVYYYYRYPARFSFNFNIGTDFGATYTDVGGDTVDVAFERPLGVYVPGHYEQDVSGDWVWVPGYYTY